MPSAADRMDFLPPRDAGGARAFTLALLTHLLLLGALTWGVNWKQADRTVSFDAEVWSSVPQEAAPRLVETAPPVPPAPPPPPTPAVREPVVTPPPVAAQADIALEQEKKRKQEVQALARQKEQDRLKAEVKAQAQAELQAKKEQELKARDALAKRKAQDAAKLAEAKKEEARELDKKKQAEAQAQAQAQKQRQDALNRMMGLAGATGGADAKGSALKSSGPSASYGGKVRAKVLPNVVFTEDIEGNPTAEVEVRTTLDGTILSQRLVKSSGNKGWDDAVIKAIIRTGTLPRDTDGRVPTPMILEFRPKG